MPIAPHLRRFYRTKAWLANRRRILVRAWNRCESCRKPNHKFVRTVTGRTWMYWREEMGFWTDHNGRELPHLAQPSGTVRIIYVRLQVAHLNHRSGEDTEENLRALCAWCHLDYDKQHHKQTRCTRKDSARPLLAPFLSEAA
jgi:hypothetical protein